MLQMNLVAVAVLSLSMAAGAFATEIVGHRGASNDAPENTLSSFKLGYAEHADADELDIHLTKDGKIVVIHDYETNRVAGTGGKVVNQTFDEIRSLNVANFGKWKDKGLHEQIPTLDEVLALVPDGKKLFIEIKVGTEILPALEETLRRAHTTADQTVIITFSLNVAEAAKKKFPDRQSFWLVGYSKDKMQDPNAALDQLIAQAKKAGIDGLDLDYHLPLDEAAIKRVHDAGLKLHIWTLDDAVKARALANAGVDGITTNRCGDLRREMAAQ